MIMAFAMYVLFASTFAIGKMGLLYSSPIFFIGSRMFIAGLLLLFYQWWKHGFKNPPQKKHFLWFLGISLFHIYISYVTEFWALRYLTAAKTCLLYNLTPFISALFSYFYFSEKMTPKKWIGLGLGFAAFVPVIIHGAGVNSSDAPKLIPELFMLVSVVSAAYGWILFRHMTKVLHYSPVMINGVGMVCGGFLALVTSLIAEPWPPIFAGGFGGYLLWLSVIIIVANFICYNLFGYMLRKYTATFLSFVGFTCPIFAAIFGWVLLGEKVSKSFFLTIALVAVGLYVFYQEELKQGYIER